MVPSLRTMGGLLQLCVTVAWGFVLFWAGSGVLALEGFVRRIDILGSWHRVSCFRGVMCGGMPGRCGALAVAGRRGTGHGGLCIGP